MNRRFTTCLAVAVCLGGVTLWRASAGILEDRFKMYDKNGDGVLSGEELDAAPFLRRMDLNGDGIVTLDEARQAFQKLGDLVKTAVAPQHGPRTDQVFKMLDRNGDGKLTPDELKNPEIFKKLDQNHDGVITLAEALAVVGEFLPKEFGRGGLGGGESAPPPSNDASVTESPQILKGTERGLGRMTPDLALHDLQGRETRLSAIAKGKPLVIGFFSANCPVSGKLGPEMARLESDYTSQGVAFVWVSAIGSEKAEDIQKFAATHHLTSALTQDTDGALARTLGAETTTEAFLLDGKRTMIYRGAINDQYGLGYALDAPRHAYLRDALNSQFHGETPLIAATSAPGCALDAATKGALAATPTNVTYHKDVARILNQNCVECHRAGGIGPFTLTSYEDVLEHAGMIRKQIDRGVMPPWFASAEESGTHAIFANDRSLSIKDKTDLLTWLSTTDRPRGDAADAPTPRQFASEWTIGKPDLIVQIPKPIAVKAEGTMPYQNVVVETTVPEDKWVQAYEIIPTARQVVHHVVVWMQEKDSKVKKKDEASEGFWAAYVPGNSYRILPEGFAKKLPAGARIKFQIHYTPTGKAVEDQLRLGMVYAKHAPQYAMHVAGLANPRINIPAGDAHHVETFEQIVPANMMVTGYMPHMHVRGKSFKYELTTPDGKTETLLDVPRYDFNWQIKYVLAKPRFIPVGSLIKLTAVYDNSTQNPANPDSTKVVRWGQQTSDEMMIGYVEHYLPVTTKIAAK